MVSGSMIERRRFIRVESDPGRPEGLYISREGGPTYNPTVVDIGQRGVGFLFDRSLDINEVCSVALILPGGSGAVLSVGVIRFKQQFGDSFGYGIEFEPHAEDEAAISQYINQKIADAQCESFIR